MQREADENDGLPRALISVLGPLTVCDPIGDAIQVSQPLHRQVLATLALYPGVPCRREWLASAVWGTTPPRDPLGALRTVIYSLRRAGIGIDSGDEGYALHAGQDDIDVFRFRDFAHRGRITWYQGVTELAAVLLGEAVRCWRDPALADLPDTPALEEVRAHLVREHQDVQDLEIDARLALGEHRAAIGPLRERLASDLLREHACAQLMLALARDGLFTDALSAFADTEGALRYHYGTGPGPELIEIRRRIAAGESAQLAGAIPPS